MKKVILFFTILLALLLFSSCYSEADELNIDEDSQIQLDLSSFEEIKLNEIEKTKYYDYLERHGFDIENVGFRKDFLIVEGDMRINYEAIEKKSSIAADESDDEFVVVRQRAEITSLPSDSYIEDITYSYQTVNIHRGGGNFTYNVNLWTSAINAAVAEWNNLGNTNIKLRFVGNNKSNSDLYFFGARPDDPSPLISSNLIALTGVGGLIDENVTNNSVINIFFNSLSFSEKKSVIMHEIGHAVGFRHTNLTSLGFNITCTDSSDSQSIMSVTRNRNNDEFTEGDLVAISNIHRHPSPSITTPSVSPANIVSSQNLVTRWIPSRFGSTTSNVKLVATQPFTGNRLEISTRNDGFSTEITKERLRQAGFYEFGSPKRFQCLSIKISNSTGAIFDLTESFHFQPTSSSGGGGGGPLIPEDFR